MPACAVNFVCVFDFAFTTLLKQFDRCMHYAAPMKKASKLFSSFLLSSLALTAAAARHEPEPRPLPAKFSPETGVTVRILLKKDKISMQVNAEKPVEIGELDPGAGMTGNKPVIVADFNFDGASDLAVLDGIGYNGVNMFYRVYLWEKGQLRFREVKAPISNPVLYKDLSLIVSAQRSGSRWYQTMYRVVKGDIYRYADAQMLNSPELWGLVFPDEQGQPGKRAVVTAVWLDNPAGELKPAEVDYSPSLCNGEKAPAKGVVDKQKRRVQVLDFREEGAEIQIQPVGKTEKSWVSADCVNVK